jgi:CMP-N,N'-diacetyllegionaminic acid synthase
LVKATRASRRRDLPDPLFACSQAATIETMTAAMEILFLLVGRGGSKGLPGKNLREIGGISLIGYKAISARQSRYCSRLIVSSDSPQIQAEAKRHGAEVLFSRPAELATDTASSNDVILHAMDWIESHERRRYDAIMVLEPSSPFARSEHYDEAAELFTARRASLVVGLRETEVSSIFIGPLGEDGSIGAIVDRMLTTPALRRQDQAPEVTMNGTLYLIGWDAMRKHRKVYADPAASYGILMDRLHSIEIENAADLAYACYVVEHGLLDTSPWRQGRS